VNSTGNGAPAASRGGQGNATRRRPRVNSKEWAAGSPGGRCGQLRPSTAANSGSLPCVAAQRSRTVATDNAIASCGWWQVTQPRPLVPSAAKNGWLRVSTAPPVLSTPTAPAEFA
jgi:hypothetical protein